MVHMKLIEVLYIGALYVIFPLLSFYVVDMMGEPVPFSIDAFFQPYTGDYAVLFSALITLGFLDLVWYHANFRKFLANSRNHMLLLVLPEVFNVFGFLMAVLEMNPWAPVPFYVIGFGHFVYAYVNIMRQ